MELKNQLRMTADKKTIDWIDAFTKQGKLNKIPKDLAISISLEAAELLEVFQWSASDIVCEHKRDKIQEELADVLNYCILMADACNFDMDEIIREKVKRNQEKYPVEKAKDSAKKYNEF